jgi:TonB family protein
LLSTAEADVPFTWGALRPRIILPASASVWSKRRFGAVLAHELAHVARSDWLTQVFAELTTAVYWFHPLAWHALAQLKREQEQACDDRVLAGGVDACVYAAELLALARAARWRDFWAPVPADFARSYLEERMKSILNRCTSRRKSSPVAIAIISVGAIAATLALTTVRVQAVGTLPKAAEAPAQSTKTQIQPDAKTEKNIQPPTCISCPDPAYPKSAKERKVQGTVTLSAVISMEGRPLSIRVERSPDEDLASAAFEAVKNWRFNPGTLNGNPVEVKIVVEVVFKNF